MSKEEMAIWVKRKQIIFVLKQKYRYPSEDSINQIETSIFRMSDHEVEETYQLYKDQINQGIWVDCYPMYFHITEFESALKSQLAFLDSNIENEYYLLLRSAANDYFISRKKANVDELTIEEKEELFWLTHPIML